MIDLSANENPYKRSEDELECIIGCFGEINRYMEYKDLDKLLSHISDYCGASKKRIVVSHGTDSLIEMVMLKFFKGRDLVVLNPSSYRALGIAKDLGMKIRRIQLKPSEFKVDWESMNIRDSFVIIDYPNNPTGKSLINRNELVNLLDNGNLVVVDEAAYEYSKDTFIDLVEKHSNLVVTRTFDKAFGLAGFKVSYMVMGDDVSEQIDKVVYINKPACFGALKALSHREYMEKSVVNTLKEREFLEKELSKKGLKVFASKANFILVKTDIPDFAFVLQEKQILIEDLSKFWLNGYYRISVGSREESESLIKAIE